MKNYFDFENVSEEEKERIIREAMDETKQKNFYEKMRKKIQKYIAEHPNSKFVDYLLIAPDIFNMLCGLLADKRVPLKNKLYIAAAIVYFISPLDLITDVIPGIGITDDVLIAVTVINQLLNSVDEDVLKEHWAGDGNIIEKLKELLDMADSVMGKGILSKIKSFILKK